MIRTIAVALFLMVAFLLPASPRAGAADLLANGGFEDGAIGWSLNAGSLEAVSSPVFAGDLSGRFSGSGQPTTQFAYQLVGVQPDERYEASAWVAATGASLTRVYLRVSWFDSGSQLISQSDSAWLPQFDGSFYRLSSGSLLSPSATRLARVSAVVQSDSLFTAHLDDFNLAGPAPLPFTPTPLATPAPTFAPTVTPSNATPTPSRTPRPVPSRTPVPTSFAPPQTPQGEPIEPPYFQALVNGSFEDLRADGSPYGWRKQGGEIISAAEPRTNGARALALRSQTNSTKWAYQTVSVVAGSHYQASVDAYAGNGTETVFLRVSWYASADGSGAALSSVDSIDSATSTDTAYRRLATAAVEAPTGAESAKIRLMLRPPSDEPAVAYFDAASFTTAEPAVGEVVLGPARGRSGNIGGPVPERLGEAEVVEVSSAAPRTPVRLTNAKPLTTPDAVGPLFSGGGGQEVWAIALAIGVAMAAVAIAGGHELWQRRTVRDKKGSLPED